jgi:hypothetical protein
MAAPGSFILLSVVLLLVFGACMVAGAVAFYFGWRKKNRGVQWLSALPFGVGLFIVAPLLLLALGMVIWWFAADWQGIDEPASPPPAQEQVR